MSTTDYIDELRIIAYNESAKPIDRVSACSSLYGLLDSVSTEIDKIVTVLDSIVTTSTTPDAIKIKAINLLTKISNAKPTEQKEFEDIESVKAQLMEHYIGCQTPTQD